MTLHTSESQLSLLGSTANNVLDNAETGLVDKPVTNMCDVHTSKKKKRQEKNGFTSARVSSHNRNTVLLGAGRNFCSAI